MSNQESDCFLAYELQPKLIHFILMLLTRQFVAAPKYAKNL